MIWSKSITSLGNSLWRGFFLLFITILWTLLWIPFWWLWEKKSLCLRHLSSSSLYKSINQYYNFSLICACVYLFIFFRPFRPSLTSGPQRNSLRPVQSLFLSGENLLSEITMIGGNDSGIFVSFVQPGSDAEQAGVKVGHHLLMVSWTPTFVPQPKKKKKTCSSGDFVFPQAGGQYPWRSPECGFGHLYQGGSSLDPAEMHWTGPSPLQVKPWWWVQTLKRKEFQDFSARVQYFEKSWEEYNNICRL